MMAKKTVEQKIVDPEYLFFEAKREKQFITGSEAVREAVKRANVDMAIAYPITPQSESMHLVGDIYAEGYIKDYFRGESEFAVMSSVAGAAMGGVRVFTGKVVLDGKPFLTSNVLEVGHCVHKELAMLEGIRAVMSIPLKTKKSAFGCITVYKKTPDPFTEHDILVSSIFASQIAEVIEKMYFIEELKIQATFDSLTGVYNKNALIKELNSEIKLTLRHGHETSIIFIDIDNFKAFNDTHGHLLGDKLLADFAGLLRQHCRKTDMIGRFGGEEFVAVALHTDKAGALSLADKMREAVSSHKFTGKDEHVCITFSAGISSVPEDGTEATEVLEKADDAMYQSKRNGKNCVTIFSPQFTAY
ncbi:diguanylate cyclase [Thermodesulfovibrionales bacterium]|nr:diguanylate cyclase [Thermodesulfovibrionales bacterium]